MKITIDGKEYNSKYSPMSNVYLIQNWSDRDCQVVHYHVAEVTIHVQLYGARIRYELANPPMYMRRHWEENELYGTKEEAQLIADERNSRIKQKMTERGLYGDIAAILAYDGK